MSSHSIHDDITHSMTHYLLAIHKLHEEQRRTRLIDVAKQLTLARSSVTIAVRKLKAKKLVEEAEDGCLILTAESHKIVHEVLSNRTLVYYFFKNFLKISEKHAQQDACLIENIISEETQEKLFKFMRSLLTGEDKEALNFDEIKQGLCLCQFNSLKEFKGKQKGDNVLPSNRCCKIHGNQNS